MLTGASFAGIIVSRNDTVAGLSGLALWLSERQQGGTKEVLNKA